MAPTSTSADKPLPTPPTSRPSGRDLARLSVESRAHLRLFIKHALAEENVEGASSWAKPLELALRELCDAMVRGAWLVGLKEARKAEQNRRWLEEKEERERKQGETDTTAKEGDKAKGRGRDKDKGCYEGVWTQTPDASERFHDERTRRALVQISRSMSEANTPRTGLVPAHLLITLSPKNAILPPRDNVFDEVPSNKMCLFTADKYLLPSAEEWKRGAGGIVLYGLDEWDGKSISFMVHTYSDN